MSDFTNVPETQPFFFEGNEVGVLVSHGFTGSPQSMRYLGEYLHRAGGFTVLGPRLTGHGTTPEDMANSTAEQWVRSLENALDKLKERCRVIFITGLSMGGTLSLYMAAAHAADIRGTIPINGALFLNNPDLAGLAFMKDAPAVIQGVGSDIKEPGIVEMAYPVVPVPAIRQILGLMAATREMLPRVTCPLLIFQSREDHVVPPPNGDEILARAGSVQKELVWLDHSYHVATLDYDKERIASETVRFIQKHTETP